MNVKRSVATAATLVMLVSLAPPAYAGGSPVTEDECRGGGGSVFVNANGSRECSGGTFDRRLVV